MGLSTLEELPAFPTTLQSTSALVKQNPDDLHPAARAGTSQVCMMDALTISSMDCLLTCGRQSTHSTLEELPAFSPAEQIMLLGAKQDPDLMHAVSHADTGQVRKMDTLRGGSVGSPPRNFHQPSNSTM